MQEKMLPTLDPLTQIMIGTCLPDQLVMAIMQGADPLAC